MNKIFIVSHTHWDREWYLTFQHFRFKLIKLIDNLLDLMESNPRYKHFVLDGQTIVLEDYLEIRPENENRIKKLVNEGGLSIGPWYILPDEFLISAEAHIRNLLIGMQVARRFGEPMMVGYMPDPFGHISQMPQILKGFGLDSFIFTRGMGDELDELGTEFIWQASDGSQVLAINQPGTYGDGASLGHECMAPPYSQIEPDMNLARQRVSDIIDRHKKYSDIQAVLVNNGVDHLEPQPELPEIIESLQKSFPENEFFHTNFEHYIETLRKSKDKLKTYQGEFYQGKHHIILTGVLSSRIYLKQLNYKAQTLLEKYAEPILSYSLAKGLCAYPEQYLTYTWKLLLQNHPHDSICGASVDRVHQDMVPRFHQVAEIAESLIFDQLSAIIPNHDVYDPGATNPSLVVFNTLPYQRDEIVQRLVKLPVEACKDHITLIDESDNSVPCFITHIQPEPIAWDFTIPNQITFDQQMARYSQATNYLYKPGTSKEENQDGNKFNIVALQFKAESLPGLGYKRYFLKTGSKSESEKWVHLNSENFIMENELVRIQVFENGSFDITEKNSGKTYSRCHIFEDTEDIGDEYDYSPSQNSQTIHSSDIPGQLTVVEETPISVKIKVELELDLPLKIKSNRKDRSHERVRCFVSTTIGLEADSPLVKIQTIIDNLALDHRLRALFPTNVKTDFCFADGHFSIEKRDVKIPEKDFSEWAQAPLGTRPQKNFVCVEDGQSGFGVFNKGLPEYEIFQSPEQNTIALTLFRSVGWLSRDDVLTRPSNAGPSLATPEAQCTGTLQFEYAVMPYSKSLFEADVPFHGLRYQAPPLVKLINHPKSSADDAGSSLLNISRSNLVFSAMKKSSTGDGIIVRVYNPDSKAIDAVFASDEKISNVFLTDLAEKRDQSIKLTSRHKFGILVPPAKILTLEILFAKI